ncbi:methyl-accepting chemotaxis protein [Saccharibacillus sp. CPCC 101409]|uniref:methyl-accepting chemotaxis protein n=1 Tax=Saccharibacillus sp. CPCC 101409 TaxID=3058041 RepID=UPI0026738098|nr:methyl-accepting chemotaxis protein [Saccharibacillus sp. CPCC 101409]MDO3410285.1 methyl-accepting chemotaxis protein [Saccharibacillus sp. CPCC 101409]
MKVKTKLFAIILMLVAVLIGSGAQSLVAIEKSLVNSDKLEAKLETQKFLKQLQYRMTGLSNDERGYLLTKDTEFADGMSAKSAEILELLKSEEAVLQGADLESLQKIGGELDELIALNSQVVQLVGEGKTQEATNLHFGEERTLRKQQVDPAVNEFVERLETEVAALKNANRQEARVNQNILFYGILTSVAVGLALGFWLLRSILKPLRLLNRQMNEIAEGDADLTRSIELRQKDEFGELAGGFNRFVGSLREMMKQIGDASQHLASASEQFSASAEQSKATSQQVAVSMQQIAERSGEQARIVDGGAASTHDNLRRITEIAASTSEVASVSRRMMEQAEDGGRAVRQIDEQMSFIGAAVGEADGHIQQLANRAKEIDAITALINEISAQTNLLSLNASIEAARAGEYGRGFTVVAGEVKKLADQSSDSTRGIRELVAGIQSDTHAALETMREVKSRVEEGAAVSRRGAEQFDGILAAVEIVSERTGEMADSTERVHEGFAGVSGSMDEISAGSREISGGTQEIAAATEEQLAAGEEMLHGASSLNELADELQTLVSRFKV